VQLLGKVHLADERTADVLEQRTDVDLLLVAAAEDVCGAAGR
jgi:hypothetical protein